MKTCIALLMALLSLFTAPSWASDTAETSLAFQKGDTSLVVILPKADTCDYTRGIKAAGWTRTQEQSKQYRCFARASYLNTALVCSLGGRTPQGTRIGTRVLGNADDSCTSHQWNLALFARAGTKNIISDFEAGGGHLEGGCDSACAEQGAWANE